MPFSCTHEPCSLMGIDHCIDLCAALLIGVDEVGHDLGEGNRAAGGVCCLDRK